MKIKETHVTMKDGTKLATDVYLPEKENSYPALLIMTPYGRKNKKIFADIFVSEDYALVVQDVRGRYDSEGVFDPINQEKEDGLETIDWIKKQSWYNKKGIGIVGVSYLSTCALPAVSKKDEIKTMINIGGFSNAYDLTHRGGALVLHHALPWSIITSHSPQPDLSEIDWEEIFSTIPLEDAASKAGYPNKIWKEFCKHPIKDEFWKRTSVKEYLPRINIPIMHMSGWYDLCLGPTVDLFKYFSQNSTAPQHLIIGPWTHNTVLDEQKELHSVDFGKESRPGVVTNIVNWFDRWLKDKDIDNDQITTDESNIALFLTGEKRWIHVDQEMEPDDKINLYLSRNRLSKEITPRSEIVDYIIKEPVPTIGGRVWEFPDAGLEPGPADQSELHQRHDVLLFTTGKLDQDIVVVGNVICELYGLAQHESDICVKLVDVYEDGTARFIADGIKRIKGTDSKEKYRIDLWSIAHTFKKDHKIGLEISGSNFPQLSLSSSLMEKGKGEYTLYMGEGNESKLVLPVLNE